MDEGRIGAVVLAGTSKAARHIRWKRRAGLIGRVLRWRGDSKGLLENRITSWINRDDYIYGENKALLYMHPELVWGPNMAFLKRTINFARRTNDRIYRRRRDELLKFLSKEGKTSLEVVLRALEGSGAIDREMIAVVGPVDPIRAELRRSGLEGRRVVKQGSSLGDNILIGKRALEEAGYGGEYFLTIGADMPLLAPSQVDEFVAGCQRKEHAPDIFYGMSSRNSLGPEIERLGVSFLGTLGPNRPAKGNVKKFGIPFIDDQGLFGEKGARVPLMNANVLLYRTGSVDSKLVNRMYSLRKMFANPFVYPRLVYTFGPSLVRALRWKLTLSEGERLFARRLGIDLKVAPGPPLLALDLDSYTDLRRASAIQYGITGHARNLEVDFREYYRSMKKRSRTGRGDVVG